MPQLYEIESEEVSHHGSGSANNSSGSVGGLLGGSGGSTRQQSHEHPWMLALIHANIGYCQAQLGQWGRAVSAYSEAHALDPLHGWNYIAEQIQDEM